MSYCKHKDIYFVDVPKTGCQTRTKVLDILGDSHLVGHLKVSEAKKLLPPNWNGSLVSFIREPIQRYLSGLNYVYANSNRGLDECIDRTLRAPSHVVFFPASEYFDTDDKVDFYRFEDMDKVLKQLLNYPNDIPVENRSRKTFVMTGVINHKRFDEIVNKYEKDFELYKNCCPFL